VSVVCPQGHVSQSTDYCDTCGAPLDAASAPSSSGSSSGAGSSPPAAPAPAPDPAATTACPHCQVANPAGALFCEACGYDFTTGALPRGASALDLDTPPVAAGADASGAPDGPAGDAAPDAAGTAPAVPDAAPPAPLAPAVPLEWVAELWVDPAWYAEQEADEPCPSPGLPVIVPLTVRSVLVGRVSRSRNIHPEVDCGADIGVSRRQAQLSTDGSRWWIEDLQSSNGTYVGPASGPLPTAPLVPGQRRELAEGDRVYVGAWTRIVVRRATDEERAAG
jgi:hypothetical protein